MLAQHVIIMFKLLIRNKLQSLLFLSAQTLWVHYKSPSNHDEVNSYIPMKCGVLQDA